MSVVRCWRQRFKKQKEAPCVHGVDLVRTNLNSTIHACLLLAGGDCLHVLHASYMVYKQSQAVPQSLETSWLCILIHCILIHCILIDCSSRPSSCTYDDNLDCSGSDGEATRARWHVMQQRHHHRLKVEGKAQHHKGLWQANSALQYTTKALYTLSWTTTKTAL